MTALLDGFRALSPNLRGAVLVMLGTLFFVLTDIVVKFTGDRIHPAQMGLFRYAIGFVLMIPLFIRTGPEKLKTKRIGVHFFRAIIASVGQAGLYYAVIHLLLADATALIFSRPLFLTILAIFVLKEVVGVHRWGATFVGFAGVLVMVRPFDGEVNVAWAVALVAVFMFAWGLVIIRVLGRDEPPGTILFWYHIFGVLIFAGPAAYVWVDPTPLEWLQLTLIAIFTAIGMNFFVRGFAIGESSLMGPMEYVRIIFAALAGYFIFTELPDIWTWIGAAIIVASTLYITRHEARQGKRPAAVG
ncbi:MAG: DMT family transporter [Rhodospirillaceae bacterium]